MAEQHRSARDAVKEAHVAIGFLQGVGAGLEQLDATARSLVHS